MVPVRPLAFVDDSAGLADRALERAGLDVVDRGRGADAGPDPILDLTLQPGPGPPESTGLLDIGAQLVRPTTVYHVTGTD